MLRKIFVFVVGFWFMFSQSLWGQESVSFPQLSKVEIAKLNEASTPSKERLLRYYFNEAIRMRQKNDYNSVCDLLYTCYELKSDDDAVCFEIGRQELLRNNLATAFYFLEQAIKLDPENYWYRIFQARTYSSVKYYSDAAKSYKEITEKFPEEEEAFYALIALRSQSNDYQGVIDALNGLEQIQGVNEDISYEKYNMYIQLGNIKKAENELDILIAKYPSNIEHQLFKGDFYMGINHESEAYKIYKSVLKENPTSGLALLSMAKYYEKKEKNEKAIELMDNALRSNMAIEDKLELLTDYLKKVNKWESWEKRVSTLFTTLEDMHPDVPEILSKSASYNFSIGKCEEAFTRMRKVVELVPNDNKEWDKLLDISYYVTDSTQIFKVLDDAKKQFPEDASWYLKEFIAYQVLDQTEKAIAVADEGIQLANKQKDAHTLSDFYASLADMYYSKKDIPNATTLYEKALLMNPTSTWALNNYSYLLADNNTQLDEAEKMITRCLKLNPENVNAIDTYAWILYQKKNYEKARQIIEIIIGPNEKNPDRISAEIWEHYGYISLALDLPKQAHSIWKYLLENRKYSNPTLLSDFLRLDTQLSSTTKEKKKK